KLLVQILIFNLLVNSLRHSDAKATINVQLRGSKLTVANSGKTPLKSEKVFKRFISVSGETPGSGLGLSIVSEICQRYGWSIESHYENSQHIFIVQFRI